MADENTHGMVLAGTAGITAAETSLGTITLPADGPWVIHHIWGQLARIVGTAAEAIGGYLKLESVAGDLEPNPAPAQFPLYANGSFLGATADRQATPLQMYRINFAAPGKAQIKLAFAQDIACTDANEVVAGIIFGKTVPEVKPLQFVDSVQAAVAANTDTSVGTITLSERSSRIVGVCGVLLQDGVLVTAEALLGFWRMASDDVNMIPAQFPFNAAYGAGLGALINTGSLPPPTFIPVDIPVPAGARINTYVDLNLAVSNAADIRIFIAYE